MSDRYYKQGVLFNMRDFISKIIGKYIENLSEIRPEDVEQAQKVMQDFQVWLFRLTSD